MNRSVCLTTIFELAADGLLVTDQQGLIQLANPALCTLFGFLPDELSDINIDRLINDVKASGSGAPVRLPDGLPAPVSRNGDFTGRKKDGSPFPVRLSFAKLTDNGDIYYAGSVHDLSREEKNKHALIHEQQLNQVKGRIVSLPPLNFVHPQPDQPFRRTDRALLPAPRRGIGIPQAEQNKLF